MTPRGRFLPVAAAGIAFQAGSTAVDSATVMSALVHQLTGSAILVGAVPAILRFGWLFPQIFVGYLAGRSGSSMPYYMIGAFGRTAAIAAIALVLWNGATWAPGTLGLAVMGLWMLYAFVSGIVAVPYNDIVARAVPSERRSRLLALRFFGGGLLALAVAGLADIAMNWFTFPVSYTMVFVLAAGLMLVSSIVFTLMGEPDPETPPKGRIGLAAYLRDGLAMFRRDSTFRRFVFAQWCGGAVLMAAPFYVVAAERQGLPLSSIATLLAAQTAGALALNLLWGWWGDTCGKASLMAGIAWLRVLPPIVPLGLYLAGGVAAPLPVFVALFFVLGAIANGLTIAVIGLLMEISPPGDRPAYSGYFNAVTAPAFLLPLLGGALVEWLGLYLVFALAVGAAVAQGAFVSAIRREHKP